MNVFTDNTDFAELYLGKKQKWYPVSLSQCDTQIRPVAANLLAEKNIYQSTIDSTHRFPYMFFVKDTSQSQFDILADLAHQNHELPDGVLCIAGSGKKLHGFRNRPWVSLLGNIHLSVLFTPKQKIEHFAVGFIILAAISVLQTLDTVDGLASRAMVKWVNDILIEKAKVCGVLAQAQTQGQMVTNAILGIGLNVETKPIVEPTPFVPAAAAVVDFVRDKKTCNQSILFSRLIEFLDRNYQALIEDRYTELLEFYRGRSLVVNKQVSVFSDSHNGHSEEVIQGRVASIGDNLELYFKGHNKPFSSGRLVIDE